MKAHVPVKRIVTTVCCATLAGMLLPFAISSHIQASEDARFFSAALDMAHVETTVSVRGTKYEIRNGQVTKRGAPASPSDSLSALRLAYARTIAERSPLLALAGTNPDLLDARAADLGSIQWEAANMLQEELDADAEQMSRSPVDLQKRTESVEAVRTSLYPTGFLHALAELERRRRSFVLSGSDADANRYEKQLVRTIEKERADATASQKSILANIGDAEAINSITVATTVSDIQSALNEILLSTARSVSLAESRALCTSGAVYACDPRDVLIRLPEPVRKPETAREAPALQRAKAVLSILQDAGIAKAGSGQMVEITSSTCLVSVRGPYFFWRSDPNAGEPIAQQIRYIGDIFYMKSGPQGANGLYKGKIPIPISIINPFLFYRCNEEARDVGLIVATAHTAAFAEKHPEVAPDARGALLAREYVRDSDAVAYIHAAFQNISSLPEEDRHGLYDLALMFRNKSAGLDVFANEVSGIMRNKLDDVKIGWASVPGPQYLFASESAFPSFFQTHNPSFQYARGTMYAAVPLGAQDSILASYFLSGTPPPRADFVTSIDNFERYHEGAYDYLLKE